MSETVKSRDLVGTRIRIVVNETPCRITMDGVTPLTTTVEATFERTMLAPAGPILFARDDDGNLIGIDAHDLHNGRVDFEIWGDEA